MTRFIYRFFRRAKEYFIRHPSPIGRLFFNALAGAERLMSARKLTWRDRLRRDQWKALYFMRYPADLFRVETEKPVATDSADHKWPHGTLYDNSVNRRFNLKLYDYFRRKSGLRVLDLGCSGGGSVKSFLEDGYVAVGVEGSDASRRLLSGEWDTIPRHLFTADITSPFRIQSTEGEAIKFDCVTAWEVLEHIPEEKLSTLMGNIHKHLGEEGIFVASVAQFPDENPLTGAVYHQTLKSREWWLAAFDREGFEPVANHPFETMDYVRGNGLGLKDWSPDEGDGFHVVLKRKFGKQNASI